VLPNIVLIGFMGSGKSSIGRRLAGMTGFRLLDTDQLIVQSARMSISRIFEREGEEAFRDHEQKVLVGLRDTFGAVVSTGGGAVIRPENRKLMRSIGFVIWLDADPEILFERAMRSGKRPLLRTENPRERFDNLLAERRLLYDQVAQARVDSSELSHSEAARVALRAVRSCRKVP